MHLGNFLDYNILIIELICISDYLFFLTFYFVLTIGILTDKGFLKKKGEIIGVYLNSLNKTENLPLIVYEEKSKIVYEEKSNSNSTQVLQTASKLITRNISDVPTTTDSSVKTSKLTYNFLNSQQYNHSMPINIPKRNMLRKIHENIYPYAEVSRVASTTESFLKEYFKHLSNTSAKKVSITFYFSINSTMLIMFYITLSVNKNIPVDEIQFHFHC